MGWANPFNPVKSIQSNQKKWVELGYWVGMDFKMKNP
jgi:arginyl-tRNA--protein-N-Asp/Glu arginylyltransferase